MALSAKRLGEKIGLTSQEMNVLLKEEGYQNGEPGDYSTTDKGKEYVSEKGWDNGYGGYAFRGYNYNEWDESILNNIDTSPERLSQIRTKTANERRERSAKKKKESEEYWATHSPLYSDNNSLEESDCDESNNDILGSLAIIGILAYGLYKGIKHLYNRHKDNKKID